MKTIIGVDGGGTKTQIALRKEDGKTFFLDTNSTNYEMSGFDQVREILYGGFGELLIRAGAGWEDISAVFFGMAGIDFPIDTVNFEKEIVRKLPLNCPYRIENDAFIALKAGTSSSKGIVLNAGTGIKVLGLDGDREVYGDAVGVSTLQNRIVTAIGRELELSGPRTVFTDRFFKTAGVAAEDAYSFLQWIFLYNEYRKPSCPFEADLVRGYPRIFFEMLRDEDPDAMLIFTGLMEDYTRLITTTAGRLGVSIDECDIVLSGGFFTENKTLPFRDMFNDRFAETEPGKRPRNIIIPDKLPCEGALSEAEKLGGPDG